MAFRASDVNLRIGAITPLGVPEEYPRAIELLIAIVLGCMRRKSAQACKSDGEKRMIDEQLR